MSFTSLINLRHCKVTRLTDVLMKKTPLLAAMTLNPPNHQPPRAACMEVEISGFSTGVGWINVSGTVGGVPGIVDPIEFFGNGIEVGEEEFTHVSGIAPVTLMFDAVVGDIEIRAVTPTGQPIFREYTIFDEMPCWVDMHRGGISVIIPGAVITNITKLFCKHDPKNPLAENDLVYYNGQKYRIEFIEWCASKAKKIHHLELILHKAKTD